MGRRKLEESEKAVKKMITLKPDLLERLNRYCKRRRKPVSAFIAETLEEKLNDVKTRSPDAKITREIMIIRTALERLARSVEWN